MAFDIKTAPPGRRSFRTVRLRFTMDNGQPGLIESPPVWVLSSPELCKFTESDDGMMGWFEHNGSTGPLTVSFPPVDGDLGAGVHPIVIDPIEFMMLAPLGATAGVSEVGENEDEAVL